MHPTRRWSPLLAAVFAPLVLALTPAAGLAQEAGRVIPASLGRAQLDIPGVTMVEVGTFGGGLSNLEGRRPEIAPLARRFRMQRRTGFALGLLALAGGVVAVDRYSQMDRPPLALGDPEANIMMGALGALTLSVVQFQASGRTLRAIAGGFGADGRFRAANR